VSRICSAVRVDNSRRQRRRLRQSVGKLANLDSVAKGVRSLLRVVSVRLSQVFDIIVPSKTGRSIAASDVAQYIPRCNRNIAPGAMMTATEYIGLVDELAAAIAAGRLKPGDRLLPQRTFAYEKGIAASTAGRVYAELLRRGLVVGEVGRGTFVAGGSRRQARSVASRETDASISSSTSQRWRPSSRSLPSLSRDCSASMR